MSHIFDGIFAQYQDVPINVVVLELIAIVFGFLTVLYSKRENILVFPTGMVQTGISVYLFFVFGLLGDMLINAYYFIVSIIGWYLWTRKVDENHYIPITKTTAKEKLWAVLLFFGTMIFVATVYVIAGRFSVWTDYVDTLTTAIFFVGMWLMAKKKLENWVYWIIGDIITVPLYWYKGLLFTSIQFFVFTIIAIYGYKAWKKNLNKSPQRLLK